MVSSVSLIPSAVAGPKLILNIVILVWLLEEQKISDTVHILEER